VIWLIVYVSVPIAFAVLSWVQRGVAGFDPPRVERLPGWLKGYFTAVAAIFFVLGVGLYLLPATMADLWPWPLAELSSMAMGSWYVGLGMVMGYATLIDDDLDRFFVPAAAFVLLGIWHLTAIVRYTGDVDFGNALMWVDLLLFGSVIPMGVVGALHSRRVRQRPSPSAAAVGAPPSPPSPPSPPAPPIPAMPS
jgi:hypothetical protein